MKAYIVSGDVFSMTFYDSGMVKRKRISTPAMENKHKTLWCDSS